MDNELKIISDCYDLAVYLSRRAEKFPRSHRYTLGAEIERRVQGLLGELVRARYVSSGEQRVAILADVNTELEVLRFQVRLTGNFTHCGTPMRPAFWQLALTPPRSPSGLATKLKRS